MTDRRLAWEGCTNARDLGSLRTRDGRVTRWGALVRSDHPAKLTAAGWSALYQHGIRTIITLATDGISEELADTSPRPWDLATIRCAIEDFADEESVARWVATDLWSTPLYYRDALQRWPDRHTAVVRAVARAQPGAVLFHCRRGHDRTGIIALLLLALVGVTPDDILADYALSLDPERETLLAREGTTTREVILGTLADFDAERYVRDGGLGEADLAVLKARLVEPR